MPLPFIGREAETNTLLANTRFRHSSLIVGGPGVGKSALLRHVELALEQAGTLVATSRVGPGFGVFLRELFEGLFSREAIDSLADPLGLTRDLRAELKAFSRLCPSNDEKAKWLLERIQEKGDVIITIDDAAGVTPSNRPWLELLTEVATVIAAVDPAALAKPGGKRFWKRFDEIQLAPLPPAEASQLLDELVKRYRVVTDEPEIYRRRILDLAQGNPFELVRFVKHHSAQAIVKARDLRHVGQEFVERDVRQIALAPLLLAFGAIAIAARYVARAQGNLDLYALSGIGIATSVIVAPLIKSAVRPRSRS